jgi:WD40 repeat protein
MIESVKLKLKKSIKTDKPDSCFTQIRSNHRDYNTESEYRLACLNASKSIDIFDANSLKRLTSIKHESSAKSLRINEINFYKRNPDILFNCTNESTINCWDLRNPRKEIIKIEYENEKLGFLSASINCTDQLICAGTAYDSEATDSFICMFDVRQPNHLLKKYTDAHSDDIVQVKFHDQNEKLFSSASLDGLVCVFDLTMMDQKTGEVKPDALNSNDSGDSSGASDSDDDLMQQVYNTNSSVQNVGYLNNDLLYATTLTNDLFVWDMRTQDQLHQLKNINENEKLKFDYVLGCFCVDEIILACLGSNNGSIGFYDMKNNAVLGDIEMTSENDDVHTDVVRDVLLAPRSSDMFTCDDDGRLCKWKFDVAQFVNKKRPLIEKEDDLKGDSNWEKFMKSKRNKNQ